MFHIAILRQPFFNMILDGSKTIESRFSFNKIAPFNKISAGDTIYLKETGKNITAKAIAKKVMFFNLTPQIVEEIRVKYGKAIGTDNFADWESTKQKKFCTLVWLENVEKIDEIKVKRSNGSAWFVLDEGLEK